jgi:hypothetical protein
MFVYLNYFKNQNYHKYTHLLQIYVDFSCTDLVFVLLNAGDIVRTTESQDDYKILGTSLVTA